MVALGLTTPLPTAPCRRVSLSTASLASSLGGLRLGTTSGTPLGSKGRLVAKAKRENEMAEIRERSTEELQEEVVDLKGEILMQKLLYSARKDYDQGAFRRMRKRIARMMTVKREREIQEGIGKRLSRKLDKKWKRSIVPRPPPSLRKMLEENKESEESK